MSSRSNLTYFLYCKQVESQEVVTFSMLYRISAQESLSSLESKNAVREQSIQTQVSVRRNGREKTSQTVVASECTDPPTLWQSYGPLDDRLPPTNLVLHQVIWLKEKLEDHSRFTSQACPIGREVEIPLMIRTEEERFLPERILGTIGVTSHLLPYSCSCHLTEHRISFLYVHFCLILISL